MFSPHGQLDGGSRPASAASPASQARRRSSSKPRAESISNLFTEFTSTNDHVWNNGDLVPAHDQSRRRSSSKSQGQSVLFQYPAFPGEDFDSLNGIDSTAGQASNTRRSSKSRGQRIGNQFPSFPVEDFGLPYGTNAPVGADQGNNAITDFNAFDWNNDFAFDPADFQNAALDENLFGDDATQYALGNVQNPSFQDYALQDNARRASLKFEANGLFAVPTPPSQPPPPAMNPQFIDPILGGEGIPDNWGDAADEPLFVPENEAGPSNLGKHGRSSSTSPQGNKRIRGSSNNSGSSGFKSSISASESEGEAALRKSRAIKKRNSAVGRLQPEKPKTDVSRPWVRTNITTAGLTSRTAKINQYVPEYEMREHPLGTWHSQNYEFKYNADGEFAERVMSTRQIKEYIFQYPKTNKMAKLKIWIQKGPSDSARRYNTSTWAKCRFKDCPVQLYQTGTILHGHYRVAFDEKWHRDRENSDPHLVSGYAHLYCMERFLDFASVCRHADVEVDTRQLTNEPGGKFTATLAGMPECGVAQDFVYRARRNKLHESDDFQNYPRHANYPKGKPKPHRDTLTYCMFSTKNNLRPSAQVEQLSKRKVEATQTIVHQGDLELLMQATLERKNKQRKGRKRAASGSDDEGDAIDSTVVQAKVKNAKTWAKQKLTEQPVNHTKRRKLNSGNRPTMEYVDNDDPPEEHYSGHSEDEDEDEDEYHGPRQSNSPGSRRSDRIRGKRPINYGELQSPRNYNHAQWASPHGYAPAQAYAPPPTQATRGARNPSFSSQLPQALQDFISPELQERLATPEVQQYFPIELYNDPDLDQDDLFTLLQDGVREMEKDQNLGRRKSSLISILKSPASSRKSSSGSERRISFGKNQMKVFDSELPAKEHLEFQPSGQRRSSRKSITRRGRNSI